MNHKIITPDLQENLYRFDSKNIFYSIGENFIGIITPGKNILLNYDYKPEFKQGGKGQEDTLIIKANHNLNEIEYSVLEQYKVKPED